MVIDDERDSVSKYEYLFFRHFRSEMLKHWKDKRKTRSSQSLYRSYAYHRNIGSFQEIAFIDFLLSFSSWIPIHIRNVNFTISIHVKFWFNHVRCHKLKTTEMVAILDFDLCEKCQLYKDNPVNIQFIYRLGSIMLVDYKKKLLFIFPYCSMLKTAEVAILADFRSM